MSEPNRASHAGDRQVSQESVERAEDHAQQSKKHGERLVQIGQSLQASEDPKNTEVGKYIEEEGNRVIHSGDISDREAEAARAGDRDLRFERAERAHSEAIEAHIKANNAFLEAFYDESHQKS